MPVLPANTVVNGGNASTIPQPNKKDK